ncbi:MAG: hypothetical protein JWR78_4316 [Mycobacterium sp.]|nr:hypothetical protein [Mycobacterium sp.]
MHRRVGGVRLQRWMFRPCRHRTRRAQWIATRIATASSSWVFGRVRRQPEIGAELHNGDVREHQRRPNMTLGVKWSQVQILSARHRKGGCTCFLAAVTAQPTAHCTELPWYACPATHRLAATSSAKEPRAAPRKRSCDCSNEPRPRDLPTPHPGLSDRRLHRPSACQASQEHHPRRGRQPLRRPDNHRLPTRTRKTTQRRPGHQLPSMAHRCLTINSNRSINQGETAGVALRRRENVCAGRRSLGPVATSPETRPEGLKIRRVTFARISKCFCRQQLREPTLCAWTVTVFIPQ